MSAKVDSQPTHEDGLPITEPDTASSVKAPASNFTVLPPEYYARFLSVNAKERKPSPIRSLFPLESTPGVISLLAGKPNPDTFPFAGITLSAYAPPSSSSSSTPSSDEQPKLIELSVDPGALRDGLQYGPTAGYPPLLKWLAQLQEISHGRVPDLGDGKGRGEGWRMCVTVGSQDGIYKAVQALVDPGDSVLCESPMYAGVIPMFEEKHCDMIEVETDAEGIRSSSLRTILESWPPNKPKPRVLYTVPYGCNPTGATASIARRKEVLALARQHDFIILEDDPYFYLYYGTAPRPPSYFALELTENGGELGRVLRFDSLSKVLSAGMRLGFASGPAPLIQAIEMHTATSNLQSPGLTQTIAWTLLTAWGHEGLIAHTRRVSRFYEERRDVFQRAMEQHLTGLCEWAKPEAGMFFWFKLLTPSPDSASLIREQAFKAGVLALPGVAFLPLAGEIRYVRASFSLTPAEDVDEALRRLKDVISEARKDASD